MAKPIRLSPSSLNLFLDCPRCFWLNFNGKKRPRGIFPSLPSGMDNTLKEYFDYYRKKGTIPPEIEHLKVNLYKGDDLKDWQNNFKGIQWTDRKTGVLLRGAVDEMLEKKGRLIVLDFKTRGFPLKEDTPDHYQNQLNIYALLLKKNKRKAENYAYLLFYRPKRACRGKDCKIDFHAELIRMNVSTKDGENVFRDAVDCLNLKKAPKANAKCEYCKFKERKD